MKAIAPDHRFALASLLATGMMGLTAGDAPLAAQGANNRTFDPVVFFSGRTEGNGTLDTITDPPKATRQTGVGAMRRDGTFVLDQTVDIEGDPTRQRQWLLREIGPGRFRGTLSDARGAVTSTVTGNRVRIRYTLKDGYGVDQTLTLSADGRSAFNNMKLKKFGITVGTIRETIRKI
jgi:hypothetical protein